MLKAGNESAETRPLITCRKYSKVNSNCTNIKSLTEMNFNTVFFQKFFSSCLKIWDQYHF